MLLLLFFVVFTQMFLHATQQKQKIATTDDPDTEVKDFRLDELKIQIKAMHAGPERDFFAGVLANRTGHTKDSIRLLNNSLPGIRKTQPARTAIALEALADDYTKSFRYRDAARTYDDLLMNFPGRLDNDPKDDSAIVHLLKGAPPQTISWQGPVQLKTEHNAIGSLNTELTVNGVKGEWLLDTGASMSVVSKSFAQRLGLNPLPGTAQTGSGITGIQNQLQVALLPAVQMGGATFRNVVVMILDDANLKIEMGDHAYQINAIIGFPVFQALRTITFFHEGQLEAGNAAQHSMTGTRMYLKLLKPIIECAVDGKELPFSFDTGANETYLSLRYYARFRGNSASWSKVEETSVGAGGVLRHASYKQPTLNLTVGNRTATLKNVTIFPAKSGPVIDEFYGNIGQDFVAGFESFTLDFSNMIFSLGAPLAAAQPGH